MKKGLFSLEDDSVVPLCGCSYQHFTYNLNKLEYSQMLKMERHMSWIDCSSFQLKDETVICQKKKLRRFVRSHSHDADVFGGVIDESEENWRFRRILSNQCAESKQILKGIIHLIHRKCLVSKNSQRILVMLEDLRNICLNYWHTPTNKMINYAASQTAQDLLQIELQVEQEVAECDNKNNNHNNNKKRIISCRFILEAIRLIRFATAKIFHLYELFTLNTREEWSEEDTLYIEQMNEVLGKVESDSILEFRKHIRTNAEYTDNLMKIDNFLLEGFVKEEVKERERRAKRQFFRKRLVLWIQTFAEQKMEELESKEPQMITCRICDKQFNMDCISQHTSNCQNSTELRRQIIDLDVALKQSSEDAFKIQQKYTTQRHLQRKRKVTGFYKAKKLQEEQGLSPVPNSMTQSTGGGGRSLQRSSSLNVVDQVIGIRQRQNSQLPVNGSLVKLGSESSFYNSGDSHSMINYTNGSLNSLLEIIPLAKNTAKTTPTIESFQSKGTRKSSIMLQQFQKIDEKRDNESQNKEEDSLSEGSDHEGNQNIKSFQLKLGKTTFSNRSSTPPNNRYILEQEKEFDYFKNLIKNPDHNTKDSYGSSYGKDSLTDQNLQRISEESLHSSVNFSQAILSQNHSFTALGLQSLQLSQLTDSNSPQKLNKQGEAKKSISDYLSPSNRQTQENKNLWELQMISEEPSEKSPRYLSENKNQQRMMLNGSITIERKQLKPTSSNNLRPMLSDILEESIGISKMPQEEKKDEQNQLFNNHKSKEKPKTDEENDEDEEEGFNGQTQTREGTEESRSLKSQTATEVPVKNQSISKMSAKKQNGLDKEVNESQDIFKDEKKNQLLHELLWREENRQHQQFHDYEDFHPSPLSESSSCSSASSLAASLMSSNPSSLSSTSSDDLIDRIQVQENNFIEGLDQLIGPMKERVAQLEQVNRQKHLIQEESKKELPYKIELEEQQSSGFESQIRQGRSTSSAQFGGFRSGLPNDISEETTSQAEEINPGKFIRKTSNRAGGLKRAQTVLIKEPKVVSPYEPSSSSNQSTFGSKSTIAAPQISSKLLKAINTAMSFMVSYGERIVKRPDLIQIDYDLKTLTNLKFSLPEIMRETEVLTILKKMILQLGERIALQRKVLKLEEADTKLLTAYENNLKHSKEKLQRHLSFLEEFQLNHDASSSGSKSRLPIRSSLILQHSFSSQSNIDGSALCSPDLKIVSCERKSGMTFMFPPSQNSFTGLLNSPVIENIKRQVNFAHLSVKTGGHIVEEKQQFESESPYLSNYSPLAKGVTSIKNLHSPSRFLKSPLTFRIMPLFQDLKNINPFVGHTSVFDKLKEKCKQQEQPTSQTQIPSLISLNQLGSRESFTQFPDFRKKIRPRKNTLLKNSARKSKLISNSLNYATDKNSPSILENQRQIALKEFVSNQTSSGSTQINDLEAKLIFKEDDALEAAMARYNERKRQKEEENGLIQKELTTSSSDEESEAQRGYYSDSDARQFSAGDITFTQQQGLSLRDFEFKRVLGVGAFGAVWLVAKKTTSDEYALKIIDCSKQTDFNQQENLRAESNVFAILTGDHVVKALYSFQFEDYLCFVLDYMNGGDFGQIMRCYGRLEESIVRFYAAEIILAIEYLHSKGIIHRDLKPENVLLDTKGHIKLADFGLSEVGLTNKLNKNNNNFLYGSLTDPDQKQKMFEALKIDLGITQEAPEPVEVTLQVNHESKEEWGAANITPVAQKKNRVVGTPDYIPPEVINGVSISNKSIDWWSLGVMIYEFITGVPPFNDDSVEAIFNNIKRGHIEWPDLGYEEDEMTPEAQDLIKQLLNPDYTKRLGADNIEEIKTHLFFKGIQWEKIKKQSAPLVSMIVQEQAETVEESENQIKKKEQEQIKLQNLLKKNQSGRRATTHIQGMPNLWRVDLLATINREEAEKRKSEAIQNETQQKEKVKKLQRLATTLVESS